LLPAATGGACKMESSGNACFGIYGLAEHRAAGGGTAIGGEVTVRNFTSNSPDITLPPNQAIGTTTTVPTGWQITCGSGGGETKDCSIGLYVSNETSTYGDPLFNTAEYIRLYRQYGIYVDAPPSGNQVGLVVASNGTGVNMILGTKSTMVAGNTVMEVTDINGTPHYYITQNGDAWMNTLQYANHSLAPSLSACGISPAFVANHSDAHGSVVVGSGATGCTITFGTAFSQTPTVILTGVNVGPVNLTTSSTTGFSVNATGLAGTTFNYFVASNGS
jgi:hypothetical protein